MTDEATVTEGGDASPPDDAGPDAPRRRRRLGLVLTSLAAVAAAVVAIGVVRQPPADPEGLVILYGDSLSFEAHRAFADELAATTRSEVINRIIPGTSPCDHRAGMEADRSERPDVVVIQFVGNNASPCSRGPGGERLVGQALADRFEADVRAEVDMWAAAGARVVLVGGPDSPGLPGMAGLQIADAYNRIVNEWAGRDLGRVRYADAAATVTGPDHLFARRLPCAPDEEAGAGCEDGEVTVRSPDNLHFCPYEWDGDAGTCGVASPGAARFGREMARVAALALDPAY